MIWAVLIIGGLVAAAAASGSSSVSSKDGLQADAECSQITVVNMSVAAKSALEYGSQFEQPPTSREEMAERVADYLLLLFPQCENPPSTFTMRGSSEVITWEEWLDAGWSNFQGGLEGSAADALTALAGSIAGA